MTKIYTLFFLSFLPVLFAAAQFDKGQKVLGGNIGFSTSNSKYYYNNYEAYTLTNVSASPSLGWFTKANQLFGIGLLYNYNRQKTIFINPGTSIDTTTIYSHSLGVSLFSQRFIRLANNFYFTITTAGSATYNFGKIAESNSGNETTTRTTGYGISANLAPGLSYRLSQRFLFEAYLSNLLYAGYSHSQYKDGTASSSGDKPHVNSFILSSSLSNTSLGYVGLGFRWLLKK